MGTEGESKYDLEENLHFRVDGDDDHGNWESCEVAEVDVVCFD